MTAALIVWLSLVAVGWAAVLLVGFALCRMAALGERTVIVDDDTRLGA